MTLPHADSVLSSATHLYPCTREDAQGRLSDPDELRDARVEMGAALSGNIGV